MLLIHQWTLPLLQQLVLELIVLIMSQLLLEMGMIIIGL